MSKIAGRPQTRFVCQSCGESFLRWEGQCRACSAWNSLVETQVRATPRTSRVASAGHEGAAGAHLAAPITLADVGEPEQPRLAVGIGELDRVLGGGLVPGSVVLVGGEPGIGKSTLLLQAAAGVAGPAGPLSVLYATG
jgi:DNA repair protein RadA/Sms